MDTVVFADKKYIKASKAALMSGYTADYVGQLCRKGKIDAVLLGKTWYVHEDSLASHKQNNADRSNSEVTRKDVRRQREELDTEETHRAKTSAEPAHWRRLLETPISYSAESEDLIPSPIRISKEDEQDSKDDVELAPEPTAASDSDDHTKEETQNDTVSVSIRKEVINTATHTKPHHSHVLREIRHMKEKDSEVYALPEVREIVVRRSLAPMVLAASMFIFLLLNIFGEVQWVYMSGGGQANSTIESEYNVASLSSIAIEIGKNYIK